MSSTVQRHTSIAPRRSLFKLAPVAAGCAVLMLATTHVYAQQADAQSLGAVTVTGIRSGIEAAISLKKNSDNIVDAISAEDIGKLPDATVAESIARLPGVTAQRDMRTGKASAISIRGMSPDFNGSLLNGREQASTGDSRAPSFDVYPAELMSGIVVYKTPDATLVGQGLSSTTDLRTVKPLDFGKRVMAVSLRKKTTGVGSGAPEQGDGNTGSFSYIDQFADRTIGLALGFTRMRESNNQQRKFDTWGGWAMEVTNPATGATVKTPGGFKADVETTGQDRDGAMAVLQFNPSKDFKTTVDVLYSKGKGSYRRTGLEGAIGDNSTYDPSGTLSNATVDANGFVTAGTMSNYKGVVRNHMTNYDDSLLSMGVNSTIKTGNWTTNVDLARSEGKRDESRNETYAGQPGNGRTGNIGLGSISWTGFNGSNFSDVKYNTSVNYTDRSIIKLTDVNGWSGGESFPQAGYLAKPAETDKVNNFRLTESTDVEWGPINSAHFGVNISSRDKLHTSDEATLQIIGGNPYGGATIPGSSTLMTAVGIAIPSFDPTGTVGSIYNTAQKFDNGIADKQWGVKENVATAFVKGNLDGTLAGIPYRGNLGVQVVSSKQQSDGIGYDTGNCKGTLATCPTTSVSFSKRYTDTLPSLNLSFSLSNDQVVRLAAAKVMARPNMVDMRATGGFGLSTSGDDQANPILRGGGGNPDLEPFRATAVDISYEKYFGKKGVVSVAAFYKNLDTYILSVGRQVDFAPFLGSASVLPQTGKYKGSTQGIWTSQTNGQGGKIQGVEVNFDLPLSMASSMLNGFGVQFNYSDTSSDVKLPSGTVNGKDLGTSIPLPGLSRTVSNTKIYYEANGFQIGVAHKKRSTFIGEISDFDDARKTTWIAGEGVTDLQLAYEFQTGYFKGLSINLSANNLNDAIFRRIKVDDTTGAETDVDTVQYGKTYNIGLNYKF